MLEAAARRGPSSPTTMSTKQVTCRSVRGAAATGSARPLHFLSHPPNPPRLAPSGGCTAAPPPGKLRQERILEKLLICSRSAFSTRSSLCGRRPAPGVWVAVCWGGDPRRRRRGGLWAGRACWPGRCRALGPGGGGGALGTSSLAGKGDSGKGKLSGRLQMGIPRRNRLLIDDKGLKEASVPKAGFVF